MNNDCSIAVVGLGPHCRRTYFNYFKKNGIFPKIIIDLESNREEIESFIDKNSVSAELLFLPDKFRDDVVLPVSFSQQLLSACNNHNITHAMIVTEPKSHLMYIAFFLEHNIHVLTEKPITAPLQLVTPEDAESVINDYKKLVDMESRSHAHLSVMCQRSYNEGYKLIFENALDIIRNYHIPITSVQFYNCDGNWIFPHDMFYENHPYKYGYGKLFHSGYHFVDLICRIVKLNNALDDDKKPSTMMLALIMQNFNDMNSIITHTDYRNLFHDEKIPSSYFESELDFSAMGEMCIDSLIQVMNKKGRKLTNIQLSMGQLGFSRRGWMKTKSDHYKGNGRVRQESLNIQIGPLMAIKVASYQSKESFERSCDETSIGGLDHFDIDIFRNIDIIGGEPHSHISSYELMEYTGSDTVGLNEEAREKCISDFLKNNYAKMSRISDHALAIELMYRISLELIGQRSRFPEFKSFDISQLM